MHILSLFEMDAVHQQALEALSPQAQWRYTTSDRLEAGLFHEGKNLNRYELHR